MVIFGIDPGLTGACAAIEFNTNKIIKYKVFDFIKNNYDELDPVDLLEKINSIYYRKCHCFIEHAQAMPGNGVTGMFNYGVGYGMLLAALSIGEIEYTKIRPAKWKKHFGLIKKSKLASVELAEELFPDAELRGPRGGLKDGRAEALLIAEYGRLHFVD